MNTTNRFQRALVFRGGGSLGAYETGVYKATYELLSERDIKLGREGKPIFHIVTSTSIGAMNGSRVSQLCKRKQEWQGFADRLTEFWEYMATESFMDMIPGFNEWWHD